MRFLLAACAAAAVLVRGQQCVSTVAGIAPTVSTAVDSGVSSLGYPFAVAFSAKQGLLFTTSSSSAAGVWSLYSLSGGNASIKLCGGVAGSWARTGVAALSTFYGAHVAVHPITYNVYFDVHTTTSAYIQMIDSFGNLQVVAGVDGGGETNFAGGVPALTANLMSSLGVQDNSLAFGSCVCCRARSVARRNSASAPPRACIRASAYALVPPPARASLLAAQRRHAVRRRLPKLRVARVQDRAGLNAL